MEKLILFYQLSNYQILKYLKKIKLILLNIIIMKFKYNLWKKVISLLKIKYKNIFIIINKFHNSSSLIDYSSSSELWKSWAG